MTLCYLTKYAHTSTRALAFEQQQFTYLFKIKKSAVIIDCYFGSVLDVNRIRQQITLRRNK